MKEHFVKGGVTLAALLLIGQGCASPITDGNEDTSAPQIKEATPVFGEIMEKESTSGDTVNSEAVVAGEFTLTASAQGNNAVTFRWSPPDDVAEQATAYRIARGTEPDPTFPSGWWWERGPSFREHTWTGLPVGEAHFRVCAVIDGVCARYSNDVEVTVTGSVEQTSGADTAVAPAMVDAPDDGKKKMIDGPTDTPPQTREEFLASIAYTGTGGQAFSCPQFNQRAVVMSFYAALMQKDAQTAASYTYGNHAEDLARFAQNGAEAGIMGYTIVGIDDLSTNDVKRWTLWVDRTLQDGTTKRHQLYVEEYSALWWVTAIF